MFSVISSGSFDQLIRSENYCTLLYRFIRFFHFFHLDISFRLLTFISNTHSRMQCSCAYMLNVTVMHMCRRRIDFPVYWFARYFRVLNKSDSSQLIWALANNWSILIVKKLVFVHRSRDKICSEYGSHGCDVCANECVIVSLCFVSYTRNVYFGALALPLLAWF